MNKGMKSRHGRFGKIVIKIGSNVLGRKDGTLDMDMMKSLVDQIASLHKDGVEIILVSSGAVASGRSMVHTEGNLDSVSSRQLFSTVGQARLINCYYDFFTRHGIVCGQILTTKETVSDTEHYLNQKNCIDVMLEHKVIPIINENDAISITELMFTDNDELSGMVVSMTGAEALIILSNVDGIYDGPPQDAGSRVIREIYPDDDASGYIGTGKSELGRGGMGTKYSVAKRVADRGIEVVIANGKREAILLDICGKSPENVICTRFLQRQDAV